MEQLNSALSTLNHLRTNVTQIFETLCAGVNYENGEDSDYTFLQEIQKLLIAANINLRFIIDIERQWNVFVEGIFSNCRNLESTTNGFTLPPSTSSLGNTSFLAQEVPADRIALYSQLIDSYKWMDKV